MSMIYKCIVRVHELYSVVTFYSVATKYNLLIHNLSRELYRRFRSQRIDSFMIYLTWYQFGHLASRLVYFVLVSPRSSDTCKLPGVTFRLSSLMFQIRPQGNTCVTSTNFQWPLWPLRLQGVTCYVTKTDTNIIDNSSVVLKKNWCSSKDRTLSNDVLMLVWHCRRWANIKTLLIQRYISYII